MSQKVYSDLKLRLTCYNVHRTISNIKHFHVQLFQRIIVTFKFERTFWGILVFFFTVCVCIIIIKSYPLYKYSEIFLNSKNLS